MRGELVYPQLANDLVHTYNKSLFNLVGFGLLRLENTHDLLRRLNQFPDLLEDRL